MFNALHPRFSNFSCRYKSGQASSFYHVTSIEQDQRSRLSKVWAPSGGFVASVGEDAHSKLLRAGFLRQAHSGIFHMLPLGYRVQKKVEKLADRHMSNLGASKLDLSSISSEDLWMTSGRFTKVNSELFKLRDRKDISYLLSPTHEEEVTSLVASSVKSYKELPTRLYQISRKYRDELRPRHGLLRSREFIMKDLYTFDSSKALALTTYELVRNAYAALFDELKIPYLVAEADSGDMGGNLSHEFHFLTPKGEDRVISCRSCDYVSNEELAKAVTPDSLELQFDGEWSFIRPGAQTLQPNSLSERKFSVWRGITQDRRTLINVWYALSPGTSTGTASPEINTHAVKRIVSDLDSSIENAASFWKSKKHLTPELVPNQTQSELSIINLIDYRLPKGILEGLNTGNPKYPVWPDYMDENGAAVTSSVISEDPSTHEHLNLLRIQSGDKCPTCGHGHLDVNVAIELGHTFFLGTKYSVPFNAVVTLPLEHSEEDDSTPTAPSKSGRQVPMQMGCYGIGVSRMIGAVAETLADEKGLNWPRVIAPYEVVIVPTQGNETNMISVYDGLVARAGPTSNSENSLDVVLDDREHSFPWKMNDADLIGYPIIVVVGKGWKTDRICEVQCRRLNIRENVPVERLHAFVEKLLEKL